jgi:hypothetical protein
MTNKTYAPGMDFFDALNADLIPPYGMGTQIEGTTVRSVVVMKYEEKGKPTKWWVKDWRNNGMECTVYPCESREQALELKAQIVGESLNFRGSADA